MSDVPCRVSADLRRYEASQGAERTDAELLRVAERVVAEFWDFGLDWRGVSLGEWLMNNTLDDEDIANCLSAIIKRDTSDWALKLDKMLGDDAARWLRDNYPEKLDDYAAELEAERE